MRQWDQERDAQQPGLQRHRKGDFELRPQGTGERRLVPNPKYVR